MRRVSKNRYLALAADQTVPVPPPGKKWTPEELLDIRLARARDFEQVWAARRAELIAGHPGVELHILEGRSPELRELDEALEAVRRWIADNQSAPSDSRPG